MGKHLLCCGTLRVWLTLLPSFVLSKHSQIPATLGSDLELWPQGSVFDLPLLRGAPITSSSCCENAQRWLSWAWWKLKEKICPEQACWNWNIMANGWKKMLCEILLMSHFEYTLDKINKQTSFCLMQSHQYLHSGVIRIPERFCLSETGWLKSCR